MPIGPQLPPHLTGGLQGRSTTPSDDEEDFGPALPPALAAKRAVEPKKADIGPQLPSATNTIATSSVNTVPDFSLPLPGPSRPVYGAGEDDDDDDDFVGPRIGPTVNSASQKTAADEFREREARWAQEREEKNKPKVLKRDEWMIVPPTSGVLSSVDPLRRPTTFNRTSRPAVTSADQTLWTETPAEKAQRLADEVAGIKRRPDGRPTADEEDDNERKRRREHDREIRRTVETHTKNSRGTSLLEQHQSKKAADDDEEPPVIWDREKHMGVTGRLLTDQERAKKIRDAKGLNDRFGHGKGGAYAM